MYENVAKYTTCKIAKWEGIRSQWISPLVKEIDEIGHNVFEVVSQKRKIEDKKLCHAGSAVLQLSKLHLLRFIYWLHDHLIPNSFKIAYLGNLIFLYLCSFQLCNLRYGLGIYHFYKY